MKRLGKFTGKIYNESEIKSMQECGITISEEQSRDEGFIRQKHAESVLDCALCRGCPAYNN